MSLKKRLRELERYFVFIYWGKEKPSKGELLKALRKHSIAGLYIVGAFSSDIVYVLADPRYISRSIIVKMFKVAVRVELRQRINVLAFKVDELEKAKQDMENIILSVLRKEEEKHLDRILKL